MLCLDQFSLSRGFVQLYWGLQIGDPLFNIIIIIICLSCTCQFPYNFVIIQVYRAAEGATVIFSCIVDNIDGVRGQDWGVVYKVKEEDQEFEDVGLTYPSGDFMSDWFGKW